MPLDYYQELGVARNATEADIRKAYRKLAGQLHPDRNKDNKVAEDRFKRVSTAFHALSDPEKRKLYDQYGEVGLREGFTPPSAGFGGGGFEDIFSGAKGAGIGDIFGDIFSGGGRRRPRKNQDIESEITVEFVSAVRGAELELAMQNGRSVKVRIPQGATDGDKLRVKGAGSTAVPGMPPGDLLLTLRVKDHPHFKRDGLDLTIELPITIGEAYFGGKVDVPTTDGSVQLKVPPHTQSGQLLRLRAKGVKRGQQTGDLYVRFMILLPKSDDEQDSQAAKVLADAMGDDVRADLKF